MKYFSKKTFVALFLSAILLLATACQTAEQEQEEIEALKEIAQEAVSDNKNFEEKLEIFAKLKEWEEHKSEEGATIQVSLQGDINTLIENENFTIAFDHTNSLYEVYSSNENGTLLVETAKLAAQDDLDNENYELAFQHAGRALQVFWDEPAMDLKLEAEVKLLEIAITDGDLENAKKYYDDIMYVTSLKGNEKLAEKHRPSAEKYADQFSN